ncbi:MAG: hypothetical protein U0525_02050 [Patescibacteria group bacterium]
MSDIECTHLLDVGKRFVPVADSTIGLTKRITLSFRHKPTKDEIERIQSDPNKNDMCQNCPLIEDCILTFGTPSRHINTFHMSGHVYLEKPHTTPESTLNSAMCAPKQKWRKVHFNVNK